MSDIEFNTRALDNMIKAFSEKNIQGKLGVLGGKTTRKEGAAETNASVLAKHEFGEDGMPVRSVLRVPLTDNMQTYLDEAGAFDQEAVKVIIKEKSLVPFLTRVCIVGEQIVQDAFDTCGFGKWRASKMDRKKTKQTLVETQQMRNAITSEVE